MNGSAGGGCSAGTDSVACFSHRNKHGKVIKPLQYQSTVAPGTVARVEPNIKWFGEFWGFSPSTFRLCRRKNCWMLCVRFLNCGRGSVWDRIV